MILQTLRHCLQSRLSLSLSPTAQTLHSFPKPSQSHPINTPTTPTPTHSLQRTIKIFKPHSFKFDHSKTMSMSMSSSLAVSKHKHLAHEDEAEDQDEQLQTDKSNVTSHVYLKPAHSGQSLEKEEVLRRIRQRKRVTKLTSAFQGMVRLPLSSKPKPKAKPVSLPHKSWLDDPFAAL